MVTDTSGAVNETREISRLFTDVRMFDLQKNTDRVDTSTTTVWLIRNVSLPTVDDMVAYFHLGIRKNVTLNNQSERIDVKLGTPLDNITLITMYTPPNLTNAFTMKGDYITFCTNGIWHIIPEVTTVRDMY